MYTHSLPVAWSTITPTPLPVLKSPRAPVPTQNPAPIGIPAAIHIHTAQCLQLKSALGQLLPPSHPVQYCLSSALPLLHHPHMCGCAAANAQPTADANKVQQLGSSAPSDLQRGPKVICTIRSAARSR
jgi:hypothetical protein